MNKINFIIPFIVLTTMTLIASCNSRHVSTNFDKESFSEYFSASKVKIYMQEIEIKAPHKYIGVVEGQDCQIKPHHAAPDEINARTQARQQAFEKQATGVVFTGCALLTSEQLAQLNNSNDAQQCHAIVICYARAFAIESQTDN